MFNTYNLDEKTKQQELKLEALTLEFERLNRTVEDFFVECELSEEAVFRFNSNKDHFSEEAWEKLNAERTKLDEKLKKQLELIRNPKLAKQKYAQRNVAPHWLFVR